VSDLAVLGIKVDASGAIQDVQRLGSAFDKTAASSEKLTDRQSLMKAAMAATGGDATKLAAVMKQLGLSEEDAAEATNRANAATERQIRAMGLAEIEALKMDAALKGNVTSAGLHGLQLGRLNQELGTFIGQASGANTAATRLAAQIGGSVAGYGAMVGVMLAVGGVMWIWDKMAEGINKTRKEQEEANKALKEWYALQQQGVAGKLGSQIETEEKALAKMRDRLKELKALVPKEGEGGGEETINTAFAANKAAKAQKEYDDVAKMVAAGEAHIQRLRESANAEALAARLTFNQQDSTARAQSLTALKIDQEQYAALLRLPFSEENNAKIVEKAREISSLLKALNPNAAAERRADAQAAAQAIKDKLDAWNAANHAAKAKRDREEAEAVKEFEANQDAEREAVAASVRLQNKIRKDARDKEEAEALAGLRRMLAAQKQFAHENTRLGDAIRNDLLGAVLEMTTHGAVSFEDFFNTIARQSVRMVEQVGSSLDRLQAQLLDALDSGDDALARSISDRMKGLEKLQKSLGVAGIAASAGTSGYSIGSASSSGNRGSSALFGAMSGAASGAMAGSIIPGIGTAVGAAVGAVAGFVGGIIGAGHAADLSAKEMENLRKSLQTSIAGIRAEMGNDKLGAALAGVQAQFDALRKAAEDAYAYGQNEGERNKKLAELNALEAQRVAQIKAEYALAQERAQEDYAVRKLAAEGHQEEADALAFAEQQTREYAAAVKDGADATTLAALAEAQAAEAKQRAADLAKQAAEKARQQAREEESANLRLMKALNDPGYEAAARAAQERIEIEDLITKGATDATIALTKQAQAAEDLATAAQQAAEAQAKQVAQARAMQDLDVEILNAKGETQKASDLQFQLEQQRRLEDAQKNQSADYVQKLLELQQLQRDSRAAQGLIDSTGSGGGGGRGSGGASQAYAAVQATVTERTAYQLVDVNRAQLSELRGIRRELVAIRNGQGNGGDASTAFVAADLYAGSVSR
jgi:hypothetical protein